MTEHIGQLGFILLMFGVFYFLIIRPQAKRQKEMEAMLGSLKKGMVVRTNSPEIRQARRDIMRELDPALAPLLSPASDFWTMSDTRDLIFHVQEHRFTLLEIGRMIESSGLTFLGLALRNPADKLVFSQEFPEPDAARSISNWHEFEKRHPETFGDTYKIWLQKGIEVRPGIS